MAAFPSSGANVSETAWVTRRELVRRGREQSRMQLPEWILFLGYQSKALAKALDVPIIALAPINDGPRMLLSEWIGSDPSTNQLSMLPQDRWDAPVWRWGRLIRLFVGEGPELGRHQVARLGHPW